MGWLTKNYLYNYFDPLAYYFPPKTTPTTPKAARTTLNRADRPNGKPLCGNRSCGISLSALLVDAAASHVLAAVRRTLSPLPGGAVSLGCHHYSTVTDLARLRG
ncbi:MAG: hypothetical protein Q4D85_07765 [Corynebacterium sp.]|uniref:hypothetical protein n=1 Tax=Corynebacterium sp. TaxID=1720 RepID=UPI0026DAB85A|nr:hypothetical protein [Corynebacterium sp.]MDO5098641.1 hypothetical protein [Corynebacterium sp.]